jgi:hypothetical protein
LVVLRFLLLFFCRRTVARRVGRSLLWWLLWYRRGFRRFGEEGEEVATDDIEGLAVL